MSPLSRLTQIGYFLDDDKVYELFQKEFPGKYQIEWCYARTTHKFEPKLIFESSADETWFYLQYGV